MRYQLPHTLPLGKIIATSHAHDVLYPWEMNTAIERHRNCDWGYVCDEDWQSNNEAYELGGRILSVYKSETGTKFWIITEANRSVTTILMPEDY